MNSPSIGKHDQSLAALLAARARASSDRRLALHAGAGLVAAVAVLITRPPVWPSLALVAVAVGAYGAWGIADRELGERAARGTAPWWLRAARDALAAIGLTAAIVGGLLFFFGALGTWTL
ncbi:MAG TPA: hypothetical protein VF178_11475 [Gemmatimonadaceae bacterium]